MVAWAFRASVDCPPFLSSRISYAIYTHITYLLLHLDACLELLLVGLEVVHLSHFIPECHLEFVMILMQVLHVVCLTHSHRLDLILLHVVSLFESIVFEILVLELTATQLQLGLQLLDLGVLVPQLTLCELL